MGSEQIIDVLVGKSWKLVCKHSIYSCPDTPPYDFVRGATKLRLLKSRSRNSGPIRSVEGRIWRVKLTTGDGLKMVPTNWQRNVSGYIEDATRIDGILDQGDTFRFYGLAPDEDANTLSFPEAALLPAWHRAVVSNSDDSDIQSVIALWIDREKLFRWPNQSELLWPGIVRHQDGNKENCYDYPAALVARLAAKGMHVDGRNNGPAILAYMMAGGKRPKVGSWGWPIHHVYDGGTVIPGTRKRILHAVKDGQFFTHSGGLVAAHPAAHFIAHKSTLLAWLLRWEAWRRFRFDPDCIFGGAI